MSDTDGPLQPDLDRLMDQLSGGKNRYMRVLRRWEELMGPAIYQASYPERYENGRLTICVSNSIWMQELMLMRTQLLDVLNQAAGDDVFRELVFRVRTKQRRQSDSSSARKHVQPLRLPPPSVSAQRAVAKRCAQVPDDGLRDLLQRVMLTHARMEAARKKAGWKPCPRCGVSYPGDGTCCTFCDPGGSASDKAVRGGGGS